MRSRRVIAAGPRREPRRDGVEQLGDDLAVLQSCMTSRRAFSTRPFASPAARPRLATVISRSTNGRSSFAFGTVVVRCSC
jgi:hypothetical protein